MTIVSDGRMTVEESKDSNNHPYFIISQGRAFADIGVAVLNYTISGKTMMSKVDMRQLARDIEAVIVEAERIWDQMLPRETTVDMQIMLPGGYTKEDAHNVISSMLHDTEFHIQDVRVHIDGGGQAI